MQNLIEGIRQEVCGETRLESTHQGCRERERQRERERDLSRQGITSDLLLLWTGLGPVGTILSDENSFMATTLLRGRL